MAIKLESTRRGGSNEITQHTFYVELGNRFVFIPDIDAQPELYNKYAVQLSSKFLVTINNM
ncbi:MAG: hypothetical protein AB2693_26280, partial [Candidatus Thiodiazotropha sp.]